MSNLPDIHDHVQEVVIEKSDLTSNDEWEGEYWEDEEIWRGRDDDIDRRIAEQIRREAHEMNKISVIFFEMRILFLHPKIDTIFLDFGHNIPKYVQYEGGSNDGMTVVCCVDTSVDAKSICLQNGVTYTKLREIEIDKTMYNNSHHVYHGDGGYTIKSICH